MAFEASYSVDSGDEADMPPVYESIDAKAVKVWWTLQRITIIARAAGINNDNSTAATT